MFRAVVVLVMGFAASAAMGASIGAVSFDAPAIHSIGLEVDVAGPIQDSDVVMIRTSKAGQGAWVQAPDMLRLRSQYPLESGRQDYSAIVTHLTPGTDYDIELTLASLDGSVLDQKVVTAATLALLPDEPTNPSIVSVGSTAELVAALGAPRSPGDVIELDPGTYLVGQSLTLEGNGTPSNPIYLRSAAKDRSSVTIRFNIQTDSRIELIRVQGDYWAVEHLTIQPGSSNAGSGQLASFQYEGVQGVEVRNSTIDHELTFHTDRPAPEYSGKEEHAFVLEDTPANRSLSWYNLTVIGPWSYNRMMGLYDGPRGGTNFSWDNVAWSLHGSGHTIHNATIRGFGDTGKIKTSSARQANINIHNNLIDYGGDDGWELDDATGNCAFYENVVISTSSGLSVQPNNEHGGPYDVFRNVFIGQREAIAKIKPASNASTGTRFVHNTHVAGSKGVGPGKGVSNDAGVNISDTTAEPRNTWVLNNLFAVDRGARTPKYMRNSANWSEFHSIGGWNLHYPDGSQDNDFESEGKVGDSLAELQGKTEAMVFGSIATSNNPLVHVDSLTMGGTTDGQQVPYDVTQKGSSPGQTLGVSLRGFNGGSSSFYVNSSGASPSFDQPGDIAVGALRQGQPMFQYGDPGTSALSGETPKPPVIID